GHQLRPDCLAGHVGLELRNVVANYPFESSHRFRKIKPNSGHGDHSRLSCGVVDTQLGPIVSMSAAAHAPERPAYLARRPLAFELRRPRIHGELLKLGISVAQSTVAKYMAEKGDPVGQRWSTFLRNHALHIAAMDLFVVPTIGFNLLYVLVIVR